MPKVIYVQFNRYYPDTQTQAPDSLLYLAQ